MWTLDTKPIIAFSRISLDLWNHILSNIEFSNILKISYKDYPLSYQERTYFSTYIKQRGYEYSYWPNITVETSLHVIERVPAVITEPKKESLNDKFNIKSKVASSVFSCELWNQIKKQNNQVESLLMIVRKHQDYPLSPKERTYFSKYIEQKGYKYSFKMDPFGNMCHYIERISDVKIEHKKEVKSVDLDVLKIEYNFSHSSNSLDLWLHMNEKISNKEKFPLYIEFKKYPLTSDERTYFGRYLKIKGYRYSFGPLSMFDDKFYHIIELLDPLSVEKYDIKKTEIESKKEEVKSVDLEILKIEHDFGCSSINVDLWYHICDKISKKEKFPFYIPFKKYKLTTQERTYFGRYLKIYGYNYSYGTNSMFNDDFFHIIDLTDPLSVKKYDINPIIDKKTEIESKSADTEQLKSEYIFRYSSITFDLWCHVYDRSMKEKFPIVVQYKDYPLTNEERSNFARFITEKGYKYTFEKSRLGVEIHIIESGYIPPNKNNEIIYDVNKDWKKSTIDNIFNSKQGKRELDVEKGLDWLWWMMVSSAENNQKELKIPRELIPVIDNNIYFFIDQLNTAGFHSFRGYNTLMDYNTNNYDFLYIRLQK